MRHSIDRANCIVCFIKVRLSVDGFTGYFACHHSRAYKRAYLCTLCSFCSLITVFIRYMSYFMTNNGSQLIRITRNVKKTCINSNLTRGKHHGISSRILKDLNLPIKAAIGLFNLLDNISCNATNQSSFFKVP